MGRCQMMLPLLFICILLTATCKKETKPVSKNKPKRGIIIARVSTTEQTKGTSLETQEEWGRQSSRRMGVKILKIIKRDISGELFPKEHFDEIMDLVNNKGITYLFVYDFNRLSRSFPYGVMLVNSLWKRDVKIITSSFSPDQSKHIHRIQVWMNLLFAEMEHGGITERTRRGMVHKLKQGIYARKRPPWGFERVDLKLRLKPGHKEIIQYIFNTFVNVKEYKETARIVNNKYAEQLDALLDGSKVRQIINDRKYTGFYPYDGLLFGEDGRDDIPNNDMKAIAVETFGKAQKIVQGIKTGCHDGIVKIPILIEKCIEEYGLEYITNHFDIAAYCGKCFSIKLRKEGAQVRNGTLYRLYACKDCGHHFRLPSAKQIKEFRSLHPLRCMNCGEVDHFTVEDGQLTEYYRVICRDCKFEALVRKDETCFPMDMVNNGKCE